MSMFLRIRKLSRHLGIFWAAKGAKGNYFTCSSSSLGKHFPMAAENCQNHLWWQNVYNLVMQFCGHHKEIPCQQWLQGTGYASKRWKKGMKASGSAHVPGDKKITKSILWPETYWAKTPSVLGCKRCWQHLSRKRSQGEHRHNVQLGFH